MYRDEVSLRTGFRRDDHNNYRFHITLAYLIVSLTPQERQGCQCVDVRCRKSEFWIFFSKFSLFFELEHFRSYRNSSKNRSISDCRFWRNPVDRFDTFILEWHVLIPFFSPTWRTFTRVSMRNMRERERDSKEKEWQEEEEENREREKVTLRTCFLESWWEGLR